MATDPIQKLEDLSHRLDERLRTVENTLARIEIVLENMLKISVQVDELRKELKEANNKHEALTFQVQQNALVVNALKWVAASIIPLLLSVLGTVAVSWLRMGGAA